MLPPPLARSATALAARVLGADVVGEAMLPKPKATPNRRGPSNLKSVVLIYQ